MSIENYLKAKITVAREQYNIEPYDGDFEGLKFRIELAYARHYPRKIPDHEHKVELSRSEEPSLSLAERLYANPSFRNAVRT